MSAKEAVRLENMSNAIIGTERQRREDFMGIDIT
jgi:hypothetical protein